MTRNVLASNDQLYDLVPIVVAGHAAWGRGDSNPYRLEPKSTTRRSTVGDLGERRLLRADL
jgi:hypothetical protein